MISVPSDATTEEVDSMAEIFGRAFGADRGDLPPATAEAILNARLPEADRERVNRLLEKNRESGLSDRERLELEQYLHFNSLMTALKSKARRSLKQTAAA